MELGCNVTAINFEGKEVEGELKHIVGFGDVGIVKINDDRLGLTLCHIDKMKEV